MKLFLAVLLATNTPAAWAACNPNPGFEDRSCEEYGGQCSRAATLFLKGNAEPAPNVLNYGKFCGASTKCPGLNNANEKSNVGGREIDVESCEDSSGSINILDGACKVHDACLDNEGGPGSEGIPVPDRCPCDLAFLANVTAVAVGVFNAPTDKLCDEDFYNEAVLGDDTYADFLTSVPGVVNAEAVLLAAPFCEVFITAPVPGNCTKDLVPDDTYDDYVSPFTGTADSDLAVVGQLCGGIISAIGGLGL